MGIALHTFAWTLPLSMAVYTSVHSGTMHGGHESAHVHVYNYGNINLCVYRSASLCRDLHVCVGNALLSVHG